MADQNRARVGKVLLLSAAALAVMALGTWVALPPAQTGRELIAIGLAVTAVVDALFAVFLLTRS
jgi:hypothetical protein